MSKKEEQLDLFPNGRSIILPDGSEKPDPRPLEIPVGFEKPESLQDMIRRFVTDPAIRAELNAAEVESFDEADDFDIPDDQPISPHEENYDPLHLLNREAEIRAGAVKDRTYEEKAAAAALLKEHAAKQQPPKSDLPKGA